MLNKIFSKEYFSERPLLVLSGLALASMSFTVFRVLTTVRQYDFKIATNYTQYGADSFELGEWYTLYEFAAFGAITTVAAIFISARLLKFDRNLSYVVVLLQHIVLAFLLVVSNALLNASGIAA